MITNTNIKYTTDGRKVAIIGKLNNTETIVQEIYVSKGNEIPAGENFVVKSLLDAPAKSWKIDDLEKLEARYKKEKDYYSSEIDRLRKSLQEKRNLLSSKINWIGEVLKNADQSAFELLADYITGKITHIIVDINCDTHIVEIDKFNELYENKLRLVSIYGSDNGTFKYKIGQYYDFSGSHQEFIPCKSLDEAIDKLKVAVLSKPVSIDRIEIGKKYGFSFPENEVEEFKKSRIKSIEAAISEQQKIIEKNLASINSIKSI